MHKDKEDEKNQIKEKDDKKLKKATIFPHLVKEDFLAGIKNPLVFLAQGLGSGCFYPMQGTVGTLGGVLVYLVISPWIPLDLWALWVVVASILGIPLCTYAERKLGTKDPFSIVWDEWCGIWLAYLLIGPDNVVALIIGFCIFRWLDIKKPWIIGMAERKFNKGTGIMLDDIIAGVATLIILKVVSSITYSVTSLFTIS